MPANSADSGFSHRTAAFLGISVLVMHICANFITPYEFHRDEFLYFAMGDHLRLWRMDFPPFIAIIARFSHALFHESIAGLRLAPAFSHAALVYAAAFATSLFGGRRSAQMLAALAVALSPLFLRAGGLFQPVTFDQLWWTMALLALAMRIRDNDPKHWLGVGIFMGLGALTKFSIVFLAAGFVVAVLATPLRRDLRTKFPWVGLVAAVVLGHPSIAGQIALGWPVRQQMADLQSSQLARVGALEFLVGQLQFGPIVLLGIAGVIWMFRSRTASTSASGTGSTGQAAYSASQKARALSAINAASPDWRPIAIATTTAFVALLVMHGKAYYIGPIYPILVAAGAAALQQLGERIAPARPTKVLAVAAAAVALYGMVTLPFGLPVLSPPEMVRFAELLGSKQQTNTGEPIALPQDYADMLGWQQLTVTVARVWQSLPPADTAQAILVATNYGRAGALDLLGRSMGLPPAISPTGSYWYFGPGNRRGDVAVVAASNPEALKQFYREVLDVAQTNNPWGVQEEQTVHVYICRGALRPLSEVWPSLAGQN